MGVGPVEMSGIVQRTSDVSTMHQREENKPVFQQQHIQTEMGKQEVKQLRQVMEQQNAQQKKKRFDAKDKGNNEYQDHRKKDNKKRQQEEQHTSKKPEEEYHGFDVKI